MHQSYPFLWFSTLFILYWNFLDGSYIYLFLYKIWNNIYLNTSYYISLFYSICLSIFILDDKKKDKYELNCIRRLRHYIENILWRLGAIVLKGVKIWCDNSLLLEVTILIWISKIYHFITIFGIHEMAEKIILTLM